MSLLSYTSQQLRAQNQEIVNTYYIYRSDAGQYRVVVLETKGESYYYAESNQLTLEDIIAIGYSATSALDIYDQILTCYNDKVIS